LPLLLALHPDQSIPRYSHRWLLRYNPFLYTNQSSTCLFPTAVRQCQSKA
jgi:hypothetical protein